MNSYESVLHGENQRLREEKAKLKDKNNELESNLKDARKALMVTYGMWLISIAAFMVVSYID